MKAKQLAEMIKHLRKMKMEQLGGMGKYKGGAADLQDLSGPNRPIGAPTKEQHHKPKALEEVVGPTHQRSLRRSLPIAAKIPSKRKRFQGGNQIRSIRSYTMKEAEQDLGKTMTDNKTKKKTDQIELEPEHSNENII